jgi:predicted HD phosphohydrolase
MDRLDREGRRAEQVLLLFRMLASVSDTGEISELDHALQVATRAERAGADEDLVLAALLHDIGKVVGDRGHGAISAEVLAPHVRGEVVEIVRHHSAFTARYSLSEGEADPRDAHRDEPWYDLACRFVDDWDMQSFDAAYDAYPLDHFVPLVERRISGP